VVFIALMVGVFAHVAESAMIEVKVQRDRADALLLNVLPLPVAERLKAGEVTIADGIESASVVFADLVGFTALSAQKNPHELVELLNELFSRFDNCLEVHGLEKIKTIGDAYMAAAGVMHPDPRHAHHCVDFAQAMLDVVAQINTERGLNLQFRVGIDSGALVAAVIGKRKFIYDLWGDTVNTASRMETGSEPGRINVSANTYQLIRDDFACEYRGKVNAKGKGEVDMYFVTAVHIP
jgi:class 3 adenylate cyclase